MIVGVIRGIEADAAVVEAVDGTSTRILISATTAVRREGGARLSDFAVGEEVAAEGAHADGVMQATSFECVYRVVEAVISARTRNTLDTDRGKVQLTRATAPRGGEAVGYRLRPEHPDKLGPGDKVVAMGRRDPGTGDLIAVSVGVVVA